MQMNSLRELYVEELRDLYSAENQILKALPRMIRAASNKELQRAFTLHERQTQQHVKRLEEVFKMIGQKPKGVPCKGIEGIIEEAKEDGDIPDHLPTDDLVKATFTIFYGAYLTAHLYNSDQFMEFYDLHLQLFLSNGVNR